MKKLKKMQEAADKKAAKKAQTEVKPKQHQGKPKPDNQQEEKKQAPAEKK